MSEANAPAASDSLFDQPEHRKLDLRYEYDLPPHVCPHCGVAQTTQVVSPRPAVVPGESIGVCVFCAELYTHREDLSARALSHEELARLPDHPYVGAIREHQRATAERRATESTGPFRSGFWTGGYDHPDAGFQPYWNLRLHFRGRHVVGSFYDLTGTNLIRGLVSPNVVWLVTSYGNGEDLYVGVPDTTGGLRGEWIYGPGAASELHRRYQHNGGFAIRPLPVDQSHPTDAGAIRKIACPAQPSRPLWDVVWKNYRDLGPVIAALRVATKAAAFGALERQVLLEQAQDAETRRALAGGEFIEPTESALAAARGEVLPPGARLGLSLPEFRQLLAPFGEAGEAAIDEVLPFWHSFLQSAYGSDHGVNHG